MIFSDDDICKGCVFENGKDKSECRIKNNGRDKECPCIECLLKCMCINVCPAYDKLMDEIMKIWGRTEFDVDEEMIIALRRWHETPYKNMTNLK
jgi:hypothetical protein